MKKILVYYYYEEIISGANNSVTRLVASLTEGLKHDYEMYIPSFAGLDSKYPGEAKRIQIRVPAWRKIFRKINNEAGFNRIHWRTVQKLSVKNAIRKQQKNFDAVIVLGLDDVGDVRKLFPSTKIIYWIHNISALCKPQYLKLINHADYFVTPSRTAYHLLLQKLQPTPLLAEFFFMPNWCEDVFLKPQNQKAAELRLRYEIPDNAVVFIFTGGDHPVKGNKIIEKLINKLYAWNGRHLVFIIAGTKEPFSKTQCGNITTLNVGLLSPDELAGHYCLADVGLFPSVGYDHAPLTLIEMAVTNVLPVASDIGGVKEILGNDYPFLVSEPHNSDNWYEKTIEVLESDVQRTNLIAEQLNKSIRSVYARHRALETIKTIINQQL